MELSTFDLSVPVRRTGRSGASSRKRDEVVCELDLNSPVELSAEEQAELDALRNLPDSEIDYSDIPKHTGDMLDPRMLVHPHYKPRKIAISLRLDEDVVHWLKADGKGYQTRLNRILRSAMLKAALQGEK